MATFESLKDRNRPNRRCFLSLGGTLLVAALLLSACGGGGGGGGGVGSSSTNTENSISPQSPTTDTEDDPSPQSPTTDTEDDLSPQSPTTDTEDDLSPQSPATDTEDDPSPQSPTTDTEDDPSPQSPATDTEDDPSPQSPATDTEDDPSPQSPTTDTENSISTKPTSTESNGTSGSKNSENQAEAQENTVSLHLSASRYDPVAILTWYLSPRKNSVSVDRYEYQVDGDGVWRSTSGADRSYIADNLDDNLAYTFQVRAVTSEGEYIASNEATAHPHPPSTRDPQPDKPVNLQARGGAGRVLLTWEPPIPKKIVVIPEGREFIVAYLYKEANGIWRKTDSDHAQVIEGLEQNRSYTFWLKAVSNHGIGDVDSVSVTTTATVEVPSAPTNPVARKSGPWTDLKWDAPLWDGGAEITSYEYRANNGNWTALTHRSYLVIDCPYRCTYSGSILGADLGDSIQIRARNSVGPGAGSTAAQVRDTPGLSVFGVTVHENHENAATFRIALDANTSDTVTVNYATRDGTAQAVTDYVAVSDTLTFLPGDRTKYVSVAIVQDSHDENTETFTLVLSNPSNAHIVQGEATATIGNSDPMPRAWLARFGRAAAEHVLEAVAERVATPRTPGLESSLASQFQHESNRPTDSELFSGSSFSFTGGSADGGFSSVWIRGTYSDFDGFDDGLSLEGDVRTAMLGVDYAREDWVAGLAISRSRGKGDYRGADAGTVESRLTGLYPYAAREVSDRLSLWATAGYGEGDLTLTPEGQDPIETDMDLAMLAVGGRGQIVGSEGYVLASRLTACCFGQHRIPHAWSRVGNSQRQPVPARA